MSTITSSDEVPIRDSAGATATSNRFPQMDVTRAPKVRGVLLPASFQTAPLADPYDPEPGRAAQREVLEERIRREKAKPELEAEPTPS